MRDVRVGHNLLLSNDVLINGLASEPRPHLETLIIPRLPLLSDAGLDAIAKASCGALLKLVVSESLLITDSGVEKLVAACMSPFPHSVPFPLLLNQLLRAPKSFSFVLFCGQRLALAVCS